MAGEVTVESNATLQAAYGVQMSTTGDEWARRLSQAHVWIEYAAPHLPIKPFAQEQRDT